METAHEIIVRPTEVDVNGHVNNAKYYSGTEGARYVPDAPARGVPQSPRWRVGLVCAKDAKLSCRGNTSNTWSGGREERYEGQGLAYARLLALGAVTVTVNLKSKGVESRCSMTHYQLARRLARPRVGQDQRGIGLRPYRALEIKQSVSTGFDLALGAPAPGPGRSSW